MTRAAGPFALLLALATSACVAPTSRPHFDHTRVYALAREDVWNRALAALEREGLSVGETDPLVGNLHATLDEPARELCRCSRHILPGRIHRTLRLALFVRDSSPGRTTVTLDTDIDAEHWADRSHALRCYSTGVLERRLFDAIGSDAEAPTEEALPEA